MRPEVRRVLIADDSAVMVMHLSILLRRMGFTSLAAKDGIETIKLVRTENPDLLLLDLHMPLMDGVSVLRQLRSDDATAKLPIIIVTIDGAEETRKKCFTMGCQGFIPKPVQLAALHKALEEHISFGGYRRRSLRTPFTERVAVEVGSLRKDYLAVSLSEGGIYLRSAEPPAVGTRVKVYIPYRGEGELLCEGTVIYHHDVFAGELKRDPGFAVEFAGLDSKVAFCIQTLVRQHLAIPLSKDPDGFDIVL